MCSRIEQVLFLYEVDNIAFTNLLDLIGICASASRTTAGCSLPLRTSWSWMLCAGHVCRFLQSGLYSASWWQIGLAIPVRV